MDRAFAFRELASELGKFESMNQHCLAALVGTSTVKRSLLDGNDALELEVQVAWKDEYKRAIAVTATIRGMSTWKLDVLEERIIIEYKV